MPVWLVFGVQSSARVTVTGVTLALLLLLLPPPPAAPDVGADVEEQAAMPPAVVARASASAIRAAVRRMLVAFIVSSGMARGVTRIRRGDIDSDVDLVAVHSCGRSAASGAAVHPATVFNHRLFNHPIHRRSAYRVQALSPDIGLLRP